MRLLRTMKMDGLDLTSIKNKNKNKNQDGGEHLRLNFHSRANGQSADCGGGSAILAIIGYGDTRGCFTLCDSLGFCIHVEMRSFEWSLFAANILIFGRI